MAVFITLALPGFALAQSLPKDTGLQDTASAAYGPDIANDTNSNIGVFVGSYIIQPVIGLTGLIFLVLTVYAGIMWMTSAGDSKRVEKAKSILVASVTGAVIIASAYIIVNTVIQALSGTSPGSQADIVIDGAISN